MYRSDGLIVCSEAVGETHRISPEDLSVKATTLMLNCCNLLTIRVAGVARYIDKRRASDSKVVQEEGDARG